MSTKRLLIVIALICEVLAAIGVGVAGLSLIALGLAFYFVAEFV